MQLTPRYDGPTLLHIDEAIGNPSVPLLRQRRRLVEELRTLDDEQWRTPSRCAGWTVQDVVAHLVTTNQFWGMSIRAGLQGTPTRMLATFDPVTTPPKVIETMQSLAPAETLARLHESVEALVEVGQGLDEQAMTTLAEGPPGHISIRSVLLHALWDSWIHERDVFLPLGRTPSQEPDEVVGALVYAATLGPAFAAAGGSTREGTLVVEATDPSVVIVVDEGVTVTVRLADPAAPPAEGVHLRGDAVELAEALSFRGEFPEPLAVDDRWLLGALGEVFDVA